MHSLRQRYGTNLVHTHAGPNMVVINPISSPSMYSEKASRRSLREMKILWWKLQRSVSDKRMVWMVSRRFSQVMQMFKGCRKEDTAPHIYGTAQAAYRHLLTTRQDQSIILLGKSGSGKTTNCQHIIQYLLTIAGSANKTFSGWLNWLKCQVRNHIVIQIVFVVRSGEMAGSLHRFGGVWERVHLSEWKCQSLLPCCFFGLWPGRPGDFSLHSGIYMVLSPLFGCSLLFVQHQTLLFCSAAILQTMLLEKTRVTRRPEGETTFNVFYFLMAGVDSSLRSGSLQSCDIHDKQKLYVWFICWCIAVINWLKFNQRCNGDDGWPCVLVSFSGLSCTWTTLLRMMHSKSCLRQKYIPTLWTLFLTKRKKSNYLELFFFCNSNRKYVSLMVWGIVLYSQRNLCALC